MTLRERVAGTDRARPTTASAPGTPLAASTGQRRRAAWPSGTSAGVTTSLRPAPASASRSASRTSSGSGRKCGIAVSGVFVGTAS